jgi:hypothetical protein
VLPFLLPACRWEFERLPGAYRHAGRDKIHSCSERLPNRAVQPQRQPRADDRRQVDRPRIGKEIGSLSRQVKGDIGSPAAASNPLICALNPERSFDFLDWRLHACNGNWRQRQL